MLQTIRWTGQTVELLDQTKLPTQTVYVPITNEKQMWDAIKRLVVRGAPAIGVAAAFGAYLGVRDAGGDDTATLLQRLDDVCAYLATARPTAVNLFWALERIRGVGRDPAAKSGSGSALRERILQECLSMVEEDNRVCRAIGVHGLALLRRLQAPQPWNVLTHCNAGGLATVQYGTALAPIYVGTQQGVKFHVWVDETRPLLQGSRITAFELRENGIPATVICDNMAAAVMSRGNIAAVIVGADRVAANGDVANKIGTLGVAILARHFRVPFYVAAPRSSIDLTLASGAAIPIEQRDGREITEGMGKRTAPPQVDTYNPAFDVTPASLVSAIITENGVATPPYERSLAEGERADAITSPPDSGPPTSKPL